MRRKLYKLCVVGGAFMAVVLIVMILRLLFQSQTLMDFTEGITTNDRLQCTSVTVKSCSGFQLQKETLCVTANINASIDTQRAESIVSTIPRNLSFFDVKELKKLDILLRLFNDVCVKEKISFMLYGGSLLGSYRHHGKIPWDDDVDVLVGSKFKKRLRQILETESDWSNFLSVQTNTLSQWKVYRKADDHWPFIDVFFYDENQTHLWDTAPQYQGRFVYHKKDVFPFKFRLFNGLCMPVPKNIRVILEQNYDVDRCQSPSFNHFTNSRIPSKRRLNLPCNQLYAWFPFVFHNAGDQQMFSEVLKINNSIISFYKGHEKK